MTSLRLDQLSKHFGAVRALADLSLDVAAGELLILVGPSGCGKTTALRLIAGLEQPTTGGIWLDGKDATPLPPWKRQVAFAFQRPALQPNLTVEHNLLLALRLRGVRPQRAHIRELLCTLGLLDLAGRYPEELSGGEMQRAALARALVVPARLLLLDEPFSHLDFHLAQDLRASFQSWQRQERRTTILVTHDPVEALGLADRVAVLHRGCLQQVGTVTELLDHPVNRRVAEFCHWPPLNFLEGEISKRETGSLFSSAGLKLALPDCTIKKGLANGQQLTIGLQPEDILVADASGRTITGSSAAEPELVMQIIHLERQPLGMVATLAAGMLRLTAVLPANHGGWPREVRVQLRPRRLHLFDPQGQALA